VTYQSINVTAIDARRFFSELRASLPDGAQWNEARKNLGNLGKSVAPLGKLLSWAAFRSSPPNTAPSSPAASHPAGGRERDDRACDAGAVFAAVAVGSAGANCDAPGGVEGARRG
jgi:hypothetical protein